MNIKPSTSADIEGLSKIAGATGLFPADMTSDLMAPFLNGDEGQLWITAEQNGAPVGMIYAKAEDLAEGTWNMLALGVMPDAHRSGIGRQLVQFAETHLGDQRVMVVDTSSTADFAAARAFYLSQGYQKTGIIPDYWDDGDDKVSFYKRLG